MDGRKRKNDEWEEVVRTGKKFENLPGRPGTPGKLNRFKEEMRLGLGKGGTGVLDGAKKEGGLRKMVGAFKERNVKMIDSGGKTRSKTTPKNNELGCDNIISVKKRQGRPSLTPVKTVFDGLLGLAEKEDEMTTNWMGR